MTSYDGITPRVRYRDFREKLPDLIVGKWFCYHRGHLAAAAQSNREIALIARLARGLAVAGHVVLCQKRNVEGVFEYLLCPLRKIEPAEHFEEAMRLTGDKPLDLEGATI